MNQGKGTNRPDATDLKIMFLNKIGSAVIQENYESPEPEEKISLESNWESFPVMTFLILHLHQ